MIEIDAILASLQRAPGQCAALATLVSVRGSSYRRPGARLLLLADGTRVGSISGGCLEEDVFLRAQRVLASGKPDRVTYDTTDENDLVWGVGLGCQGVVEIFLEPIPTQRPDWIAALAAARAANQPVRLAVKYHGDAAATLGTRLLAPTEPAAAGPGIFLETIEPAPRLVVFGAGDDARPVVHLATLMGWHVTVADSRAGYASAERFPAARAVIVAPAEEAPAAVGLAPADSVVVLTHRYAEDVKLLAGLLPRPLAYLGVLGPRKRTDRILAQLAASGVQPHPETLERLHGPVGLDLGGTTAETIALSILAEVQCARTGRHATPLRDRLAPIHG